MIRQLSLVDGFFNVLNDMNDQYVRNFVAIGRWR